MHIEARMTTTAHLEAVLALPVDSVGIGQEGCVAKLPDTTSLRRGAERIRSAGRAVTIVLPAAWQRGAATVVAAGLAVAGDGPVTLSVNDIGTLLALAEAAPAHAQLAAGLALTQVRAHKGADGLDEPGQAILDIAGLAALGAHGVRTAEIDASAPDQEAGDLAGWRFRRLLSVVPLGWARSCPTARHYQLAPPACVACCDEAITITATQRWVLNHGHRESIAIADRARQPTLTVFGNTVYLRASAAVDDAPVGHDVILDTRFISLSDLPARLAALRQPAAIPG